MHRYSITRDIASVRFRRVLLAHQRIETFDSCEPLRVFNFIKAVKLQFLKNPSLISMFHSLYFLGLPVSADSPQRKKTRSMLGWPCATDSNVIFDVTVF